MGVGFEVWDDYRVALSADYVYPSLVEVGDVTSLPLTTGRFFMIRENKYKYTLVRSGLTKPSVAVSIGTNTAVCCMKHDFTDGTLTMEIVCWSRPDPETMYFLIFDSPKTNPYGLAMFTAKGELVSDCSNRMLYPVAVVDYTIEENTINIGTPYSKALVFYGAANFKEISRYENANPVVWAVASYFNLYYRSPTTANLRFFSETVISKYSNSPPPEAEVGLCLLGAPPLLIDITGFIPGK
ncbi:hypothetical protein WAI17_18170 [Acinetobacter baumannii]|uniref:hypothetical protein n=3 Tax=Acinetobacter baumannii TaxID=470 RepID=UPI000914E63C|nr:hypothetical protein [Acinetobacter baumannii]MCJ8917384.1 hypothetical protein [Acinetobacter baumannii]MCJ9200902.1 hypothetical protein [Acinetobacter baumannii]MDH2579850.1 hypothetical protein [Acinetobacter baumannii]MDV7462700.1 hypothetical protein [Acinetobacter baumannii]OIF58442.1 hypothetical protein A7N09_16265 [Acinetobacter baumannii]